MKLVSLLVLLVLLAGCSTEDKQDGFELGEEVVPPFGCIEYRKRGGKC